MSALPTIAALLLMQAVPGDISAEPICAAAQERDTALLHDSRGRPVMEVAINGTGAIPMVVDTAAQVSMMASDLADELHLAPLPGGIMVNGATGVSRSRLFPVDRLCNPLIDRTDIAMVELANSGVTEARGIVGMDQFVGQRLVVDRTAKRIQATESLPEPADYAVIRGRSTPEGFVEIPVALDGVQAHALVDSGAAVTIANAEAIRLLGWAENDPRVTDGGTIRGAAAEQQAIRKAVIGTVSIGSIELTNVPVMIVDDGGTAPTLLLGSDILNLFPGYAVDFASSELQIRLPD
ncbi:MAG: aspartyl protease family protein [Pseudomonadota bacterium]|nr:aspartyl protease family protein [Pseudomonadota bacterium]